MNKKNGTNKTLQVKGLGMVQYRKIGTLSADELNTAVKQPTKSGASTYDIFNENNVAPAFNDELGAKNSVSFYRLVYHTITPETKHKERVSGLLAIPRDQGKQLPMVSWQHGTILDPKEAPSMLVNHDQIKTGASGIPRSAETLLTIVRLSGNGYIVSAADYIGNGKSMTTQAFDVKGATIQTLKDMLTGAKAVSNELGFTTNQLMIHGWSQGGLNTQWLGNALERNGAAPDRLSTASAPSDLAVVMRYWFNDHPGNPPTLPVVVPLLFGSYEKHYKIKGLMAYAIRPEYLETARKIYNKKIDWSTVQPPSNPNEGPLGLPRTPKDMITGAFLEEFNAGKGRFYKTVVKNSALEGRFSGPSNFYGGSADNDVPTWSSIQPPVEHQKQLGSDLATGINVGIEATHRSTFLGSLFGPQNILDFFNAA